jgi:hypothetical protein
VLYEKQPQKLEYSEWQIHQDNKPTYLPAHPPSPACAEIFSPTQSHFGTQCVKFYNKCTNKRSSNFLKFPFILNIVSQFSFKFGLIQNFEMSIFIYLETICNIGQ